MSDIFYVAVRPDGTIMGPVGRDFDYVKQCMVAGYSRASNKLFDNDDDLWAEVERLGYEVKECKIYLIQ